MCAWVLCSWGLTNGSMPMCGRLQIIHPMTNVPPPPPGTGCSGCRFAATYCDRPITPGKVPPPKFLGWKKENSFPEMARGRLPWCLRNAILVKPGPAWQVASAVWKNQPPGSSPSLRSQSSPSLPPSPAPLPLGEWSRVKLTMANFICSSSSVHL